MAGVDGGSDDDVTKGTTTRFVERLEGEIARAGEVGVGSEIDGYVVLESIGAGGNGEVWRVRHPKTGEELALKLIKAKAPGAEEMVGFKREWETLRALKHPNIARLYDCGWWKRAGVAAPYYVMELARTKNGKRALGVREYARQRRLTAEEKVGLMVGVCRALHHAHEKGVYHRDLKPGNIAVDELDGAAEDGLGVPKVIDFGLAKVLGAEVLDPRSAVKPGDTGGTARYMSPEQVRGDAGDIGPWTDVHALGLITFELLADRLPYSVDNMPAHVMRERIQGARRARLEEVVKGADEELSDVLARATAARLEERTRSAKALGDELESWVEKRRARTRARAKVRGVLGRRRAVVLAGVACAAMVVAEVVGGWGVESLNLNGVYGAWLARMAPAWVDRPYEDVVVVVIDEEMNEQGVVDGLSARVGVEGGSVEVKGSMRPLVWKVVEKIAEPGTQCRGVGLDIVNEFSSEFDGRAAESIARIGKARGEGGAVVVAAMPVNKWVTRDGRSVPGDMSHGIARASAEAGVGAGAVTGVYEGDTYWSVDLMLKREGEGTIPSLPLALWARMKEREGDLVYVPGSLDRGGKVVVGKSAANPGGREIDLPPAPVEVVNKEAAMEVYEVEQGMMVNNLLIAVPRKANREKRTLRFAEVAGACDGTPEGNTRLNKWFNRKVVVIGDARATRPDDRSPTPLTDMKDHPWGEQVPGVYAMATAVQWLLDGRRVKFPLGGRTWVWTGVLCAAGVVGVWWGLGRRKRRWVWAAGAAVVIGAAWVAGVVWAYWSDGWYVGPWVPLIGLVLAGVGACGVWRMRSSAEAGRAG